MRYPLLFLAFTLLVIPTAFSYGQTEESCGQIIADTGTLQRLLGTTESQIEDCDNPFQATNEVASPYTLSAQGETIENGDTLIATDLRTNALNVSGTPTQYANDYFTGIFLHQGDDYVYIDEEDNPLLAPGTYTFLIKEYLLIFSQRSLQQRIFDAFIPTAHAQFEDWPQYRFTVTFTIAEEPNGASNVMFLPGIQGSRLKGDVISLWPPLIPAAFSDTLDGLAIDPVTGESEENVFVDGILETFYGTPVYAGFSDFMDELVAEDTINEWAGMAYDWRYSPEYIVTHDVQTTNGPKNLLEELENLAASSKTGKVTIIAHSMGGLVGKSLIRQLEITGKDHLVDSFVMVGTPQTGTPQAIAGLLHGDAQAIPGGFMLPGIIVNPVTARTIAQNFESAYALLPSAKYFDEILDPVITFDPDASFTEPWRNHWGESGIDNYDDMVEFLSGQGVARTQPFSDLLRLPTVLRSDILSNVDDLHQTIDNYEMPNTIQIVQIAGWGIPTTKTVRYRTRYFLQNYEVVPTREGDGTVVYPSAVATSEGGVYYFDLARYRKDEINTTQHRDLLDSHPVQGMIRATLENEVVIEGIDFVTDTKPIIDETDVQLVVSTHSPVILGAHDEAGNFTGISPNQDLDDQFLFVTENIPGSTFFAHGGSQYLFLPKDGQYSVSFRGVGSGPTTVEVNDFLGDTLIPVTTYPAIDVSLTTSASMAIDGNEPWLTEVLVDYDDDGVVDDVISPKTTTPSLADLIYQLRIRIEGLEVKAKLKTNLLKKLQKIENKLEKQTQKQSNVLDRLEAQINKKADKGKLDLADAAQLTALLDELSDQSGTVPLEQALVDELKTKIGYLVATDKIKDALLKKVLRLEDLSKINRSFEAMIRLISKRGGQGKIPDTDVEALLVLLTKVESEL